MISNSLENLLGLVVVLIAILVALGIFGFVKRFRSRELSLSSKLTLPLLNNYGSLAKVAPSRQDPHRKRGRRIPDPVPLENKPPTVVVKRTARERLEVLLSVTAIGGDFVMILFGFVLANLLCETHLIPSLIARLPMPPVSKNWNLILLGTVIVQWGMMGRKLYSYKSLLFPAKIWHNFFEALGLYLLVFASISFVVRTDPQIPWTFFASAAILVFLNIYNWRMILGRILRLPYISSRLRQRLLVIGGGSQTLRLQKAAGDNSNLEFIGWVQAIKPNKIPELEKFRLGSLHELGSILSNHAINIAVLTESESLQREGVLAVAKACENEYVQFKMVPHFFEILLSGLHPENIGGIQLLGVDCLPLSGYRNRLVKRTTDIIGALVGLAFAIPLTILFGALVYFESPGPVLYQQIRLGRNGRLFKIIKIRSMQMNAESNGKPQWAQQHDQRRLRIGAFMRRWNIDEVPQFWNVLVGEMSLVGPRPERPELIARFKSKVPHYQARHICRPGITGWAQINGWRGNTDLEERIRHDIWYLENWSIWLDLRIMLQTFFRQKNAY